ncbi:hypothetical protein Ntsu_52120 [Nocardia sp. IFM 10818]
MFIRFTWGFGATAVSCWRAMEKRAVKWVAMAAMTMSGMATAATEPKASPAVPRVSASGAPNSFACRKDCTWSGENT